MTRAPHGRLTPHGRSWPRAATVTVRLVVLFGLAWLYYLAAAEHARVVNVDRLRGDQSGYLWDAVAISMMWHGSPPVLVGERNRMPLYAGLLALTYDPSLSPDEFFEVGKKWNIRLSLLLLALLYVIFSRHLPPIVSTNLILIIAFGYSVFKAGYAQPELLFYFLVFVTFLSFCHLLTRPGPAASLWYGALGGLLAALAHLAKAAMLPLVVIFVAVYVVRDVAVLVRGAWQSDPGSRRDALSRFAWRAAAGALLVACFLGTLYPYISNSKRVFGSYFYNVNTTFYAWYDDWPQASVGTYRHGDGQGWPKMPAEQIPSMPRYWRGHTVKQIVDRVADGLTDMAKVSYTRFWYLKYVAIYVILAAVLIATNRRPFRQLIRSHAAVFWFMLLYAAVYLPAIAFYRPISGTTARMLLAHLAPLMFVLSYLFSRPPFRETRWTVAAVAVTPTHFHLLVLVSIALDLISGSFWVRLMTTYSGY